MFDAFTESFYHLCMSVPQMKHSGKKELGKIRANLTDSIGYMREICNDCSLGVPKGKRVQRQVRYERLKDEFLKLVNQIQIPQSAALESVPATELLGCEERSEFQQKIELYKEQVKKMRENLDLFKDTVKTLQQKNVDLEQRSGGAASIPQLQQMNTLFSGLKDDNERLAQEIATLTKDNELLKQHVEN